MTHRSHARAVLSGVVTAALLATATTIGGSSAAAEPVEPPDATEGSVPPATGEPAGAERVLTLVTGDEVTVTEHADGSSTAVVDDAEGGDAGVRTQVVDGQLHVIPDAALPYLAAGTLDQDLFNVTALIEQGVADGPVATTPVIVQFEQGHAPSRLAAAETTAHLESLNAVAARPDGSADFWRSLTAGGEKGALANGIEAVHLDGVVRASLEESVGQIGAPEAWERGVDGTGVTVAVLDSGADVTHPDLAETITDSRSFVPGETIVDVLGHGTHVASTVAGSGAASDGVEKGVAPGADMVVGKVLDDTGYGQDSWVIDGMEWAAGEASVVNMSLGTPEPSDGTDPMAMALQAISEESGTLFVVAAGNSGRVGGIGSPGAAEAALTVGAVDAEDHRAPFSSMGPRLGDALVKPDLTAPGVGILAARSQESPGEGWYTTMNGTSMASPHVAGAAALMLQEHPEWTGTEVKQVLMTSSLGLEDEGPFQVGAGRVDVPAALDAPVTATGSLSFGFFPWPNEDAEPVTREATYTNLTDADLALTLTVRGRVDDGAALPPGLLELSETELVVPAGGTEDVQLTLDPQALPAGATASGYLVASDGDAELARTGWGADKEEERYDLTLRATDLAGDPGMTYVVLKERTDVPMVLAVEGEQTLRLPEGTYSALSFMDVEPAADEEGVALLGDPQIELQGDTVVELDARDANEITVQVPEQDLVPSYRRLEYHLSGDLGLTDLYQIPPSVERIYAAPMEDTTDVDFEFLTRWRLRSEGTVDSPVLYDLLAPHEGIPADLAYVPDDDELALVDSSYHGTVPRPGNEFRFDFRPHTEYAVGFPEPMNTPYERAEWVSTQDGTSWYQQAALVEEGWEERGAPQSYEPQEQATQSWFSAVVQPRLGEGFWLPNRQGDMLQVNLPSWAGNDVTHTGTMAYSDGSDDQVIRWYIGDELVKESVGWQSSTLEVDDPARTQFRVTNDAARSDSWPTSRASSTEWTFWSEEPADWYAELPFVQVDFDVATDLTGTALSGDTDTIGLSAWNLPTATGAGDIVEGELEVSYDDAGDWEPLELTGAAGEWAAEVTYPADAGAVSLRATATDSEGNAVSMEVTDAYLLPEDSEAPEVDRIGGVDRYATASLVAQEYPEGSGTVYVVTGQNFADALAGASPASQGRLPGGIDLFSVDGSPAPVLLVRPETIPQATRTALDSLDPERVVVLGGEGAVSPEVAAELEAWGTVDRIAGADRYETAALLADLYPTGLDRVYVASGEEANFPDALTGAALAGDEDVPVLLTPTDHVPAVVRESLERLEAGEVVVLGGSAAVSDEVFADLGADRRLAGADRYETAAAISANYPTGSPGSYVATGEQWPDALTGSSLAAYEGVPVMLTKSASLPGAAQDELQRLVPQTMTVLGGSAAVSEEVQAQLQSLLEGWLD